MTMLYEVLARGVISRVPPPGALARERLLPVHCETVSKLVPII